MKTIHAVIGVVFNEKKQILVSKRLEGKSYEGYWELPGGKVEPGEQPNETLEREFFEEVGINIIEADFLKTIHYQYPEFMVTLEVFKVNRFTGKVYSKEGQELAWLDPNNLSEISPLLPASNEILELL